jgi:polysaccharide biosynthesis transport protein
MKELKNLNLSDYLKIIWRRKWYFAVTAAIVIAGVCIFVWCLPGMYRSEAKVEVDSPFVSEDYVRPVIRSSASDRINWIREQISSRTFLERIVEQFQIDGYGAQPDFVMENAVTSLRKRIGIDQTSGTTFTISFFSNEPKSAQNINKRLVDELIRSSTASRVDKTLATDQFLDEQLRQSSQALSAQEDKIKQFKVAHLGELPEQSEVNMNTLTGLYAQLATTENALQQGRDQQKALDYRIQERKRLRLIERSVANTENANKKSDKAVPSGMESELAARKAVLNTLLTKYTRKHPDVETLERQIQELEVKIKDQKDNPEAAEPSGVRRDAIANAGTPGMSSQIDQDPEDVAFAFEMDSLKKQIERREKDRQKIQLQIEECQRRLKLAPALEQEMSTLLREEEILKQQYLNLQSKKFTSQMSATVESDKKNETYKIIDEPSLPRFPESPNRFQLLLMGIGGGIVLGLGAAFGREMLDSTIRSEEEATALLSLPVLVSIMEIPDESVSLKKLSKTKIAPV